MVDVVGVLRVSKGSQLWIRDFRAIVKVSKSALEPAAVPLFHLEKGPRLEIQATVGQLTTTGFRLMGRAMEGSRLCGLEPMVSAYGSRPAITCRGTDETGGD